MHELWQWLGPSFLAVALGYFKISRHRKTVKERRVNLLHDLAGAAWAYAEAKGLEHPGLTPKEKEELFLGEVVQHLQQLEERPAKPREIQKLKVTAWQMSMAHKHLPSSTPKPVPTPLP